jgi:hypothetical protein
MTDKKELLIAAAPTLLLICEEAKAVLNRLVPEGGDPLPSQDWQYLKAIIEAGIAEAKGEAND